MADDRPAIVSLDAVRRARERAGNDVIEAARSQIEKFHLAIFNRTLEAYSKAVPRSPAGEFVTRFRDTWQSVEPA